MKQNNELNFDKLFSENFNVCDVPLNDDNTLLASRCNNLFSISAKYQAIYIESLGEIVITENRHSDLKIRFSCKCLRCFTFIDDDNIFGFYDSNFFIFEVPSEEFQTKKEDSLSISKITLLPSNNSENNISLLILDDNNSKLMALELTDKNTYSFFKLFSDVIDFSLINSRVFVLYEKEAKLYDVTNYQPKEILSIPINFPFPSHVQCTSTSYLVYFPYGYCVFDESGYKLHKEINKGKYIYSVNCAAVQTTDKAIVFCDEGKQEIFLNSIQCVTVLNKNIYYAKRSCNIESRPLKISSDVQHYYFAVSNNSKTKEEIKKACQLLFPNNSVYLTLYSRDDKNLCLFDFDKRIEYLDFKSNITKKLFSEESDNIVVKHLKPENFDGFYLYFFCDEKFTNEEKSLPALITRISTSAVVKFQDRVCMINLKSNLLVVRTATFLRFIYPELELFSDIHDIQVLSLAFQKNCNFPKSKIIKKAFQFDSSIQSHYKNHQILKFGSIEYYMQALDTKILQYDNKEAEIIPLVDFETFINMDNWKLRMRELNKKIKKLEIYKKFMDIGPIYSIEIEEHEILIQFIHKEAAERALSMNKQRINNSIICINYVRQKPEITFGKKQKNSRSKTQKKENRFYHQQEYLSNVYNQKQNDPNNQQNDQSNQQNDHNNQQNNQNLQQNTQDNQQSNIQQKNNLKQKNQQYQNQSNSNNYKNSSSKFRYTPPPQNQIDTKVQNQQNDPKQQTMQNIQQQNSMSTKNNKYQLSRNQQHQKNKNRKKNNGKFSYSYPENESESSNYHDNSNSNINNNNGYSNNNNNNSNNSDNNSNNNSKNNFNNNSNNNKSYNNQNIQQNKKQGRNQKKNQNNRTYKPSNKSQDQNQQRQQQTQYQEKEQGQYQDNDQDNDPKNKGGVVNFDNKIKVPCANPFKDDNNTNDNINITPVSSSKMTSIPKIEKPKTEKVVIAKKQDRNVVFIFNNERSSEQEIKDKYKTATNHEIFEPPHLDDRPIIKLTFSDDNSKQQFIRNNKTLASGFVRIFIADCSNLNEALNIRAEERQKNESLMIRISGIPPETTRSVMIKALHKFYPHPIEFIELVEAGDGSLFCDVAVKKKADLSKLMKAATNINIDNILISVDSYSQWVQDNRQE